MLFIVVILDFLVFFVIDFGAPTRPGWSTLALVLIMIILPTGVALTLLLKAADFASSDRLQRSFLMLGAALTAPIVGYAIGLSMISMGVLP